MRNLNKIIITIMRNKVKWILAAVIALAVCPSRALAQYELYVEVLQPGTLEQLVYDISETAKDDVKSIQVLGQINGKDMMFLREMCGVKGIATPTQGQLTTLDLSRTTIVGGDDVYMTVNGTQYTTHDNAFGPFFLYNCKNLENLILPDQIESIDTMALANCQSLKNIEIPELVEKIGYGAFVACNSLKRLVVPNLVTDIEVGAFQQMENLNELVLGDRVSEIDNSLILNDTNLEYIYLGVDFQKFNPVVFYTADALKGVYASIGSSYYSSLDGVLFSLQGDTLITFPKASDITEYEVPDGVKRINPYAFYGASKLKAVSMSEQMATIDSLAFFGCAALENVTLNEGLDTIAFGAFGANLGEETLLTSILIPASVRCIQGGAFFLNSSLTDLQIDTDNKHYLMGDDGALYNYDRTMVCRVPCMAESFNLPETVTAVDDYAFAGAANMPAIYINDNVKSIGDGAFAFASGLTQLVIGKGVEKVGETVINYCENLTSLYFYPTDIDDENIAEFAFLDETAMVMEQCTLFVPEGLSEMYMMKKGFFSEEFEAFFFADIMEMLDADNIANIKKDNKKQKAARCYNANGQLVGKQHRGLNIITMPDGKSMKRFVK